MEKAIRRAETDASAANDKAAAAQALGQSAAAASRRAADDVNAAAALLDQASKDAAKAESDARQADELRQKSATDAAAAKRQDDDACNLAVEANVKTRQAEADGLAADTLRKQAETDGERATLGLTEARALRVQAEKDATKAKVDAIQAAAKAEQARNDKAAAIETDSNAQATARQEIRLRTRAAAIEKAASDLRLAPEYTALDTAVKETAARQAEFGPLKGISDKNAADLAAKEAEVRAKQREVDYSVVPAVAAAACPAIVALAGQAAVLRTAANASSLATSNKLGELDAARARARMAALVYNAKEAEAEALKAIANRALAAAKSSHFAAVVTPCPLEARQKKEAEDELARSIADETTANALKDIAAELVKLHKACTDARAAARESVSMKNTAVAKRIADLKIDVPTSGGDPILPHGAQRHQEADPLKQKEKLGARALYKVDPETRSQLSVKQRTPFVTEIHEAAANASTVADPDDYVLAEATIRATLYLNRATVRASGQPYTSDLSTLYPGRNVNDVCKGLTDIRTAHPLVITSKGLASQIPLLPKVAIVKVYPAMLVFTSPSTDFPTKLLDKMNDKAIEIANLGFSSAEFANRCNLNVSALWGSIGPAVASRKTAEATKDAALTDRKAADADIATADLAIAAARADEVTHAAAPVLLAQAQARSALAQHQKNTAIADRAAAQAILTPANMASIAATDQINGFFNPFMHAADTLARSVSVPVPPAPPTPDEIDWEAVQAKANNDPPPPPSTLPMDFTGTKMLAVYRPVDINNRADDWALFTMYPGV